MFEEHVLLANGESVVLQLAGNGFFFLGVRKKGKFLVEYKGDESGGTRTIHGRRSRYEFKSVEKLRYDFERDAENAQPQG